MKEEFFEKLKEKIQPYFKDDGAHGFDHTIRVYNLAINLSKEENIDLDILKAAILLHDVARSKQDVDGLCHAEAGAKMAREILSELDFPEDKISFVCDAISVHRFSKGLKSKTKEGEILQDADRLDALGAITIARIFMFNGARGNVMYDPNIEPDKEYTGQENSSAINHFYEKILKIKPESFKTKKAQETAVGRYKFVEDFLDRFKKEWVGKE